MTISPVDDATTVSGDTQASIAEDTSAEVSSAMDAWVSPDTVVASSTGLMVKWMVVVEDAPWSSVTETSKESDPKKSGLGE